MKEGREYLRTRVAVNIILFTLKGSKTTESPSFLSCTQLCRRQKIIKPDLEMPDLEDHDRRLNTEKKELMADT